MPFHPPFLPPSNADRAAVLRAFVAADRAGELTPQCYVEAVRAWLKRHPDHTWRHGASRAVDVVLEHRRDRLLGMT